MQLMLAYQIPNIVIAAFIAVGFVSIWIAVGAIITRVARTRAIREFARFACPACGVILGNDAALAGQDVSPMEELWGDDGSECWHCHPTCRRVRCNACAAVFILRLNRQGDKCGPRLSALPADAYGAAK